MMLGSQSISLVSARLGSLGFLDVPKKTAIIQIRWPVVILCSYLVLYSSGSWLDTAIIPSFVVLYLVSNVSLYFLDDAWFDSSHFYTSLVLVDTAFLTASLAVSGQIGTDFYLVYFLIVFLSSICHGVRDLLAVAVLAPLLYGYVLLRSGEASDPAIYLRLPFPFVISLFYGYFAQLVRVEKALREKAEADAKNMARSEERRVGKECRL